MLDIIDIYLPQLPVRSFQGTRTLKVHPVFSNPEVYLYTLLNSLILKWVGFNNYILNHPKIYSAYTKVKMREESYRK